MNFVLTLGSWAQDTSLYACRYSQIQKPWNPRGLDPGISDKATQPASCEGPNLAGWQGWEFPPCFLSACGSHSGFHACGWWATRLSSFPSNLGICIRPGLSSVMSYYFWGQILLFLWLLISITWTKHYLIYVVFKNKCSFSLEYFLLRKHPQGILLITQEFIVCFPGNNWVRAIWKRVSENKKIYKDKSR